MSVRPWSLLWTDPLWLLSLSIQAEEEEYQKTAEEEERQRKWWSLHQVWPQWVPSCGEAPLASLSPLLRRTFCLLRLPPASVSGLSLLVALLLGGGVVGEAVLALVVAVAVAVDRCHRSSRRSLSLSAFLSFFAAAKDCFPSPLAQAEEKGERGLESALATSIKVLNIDVFCVFPSI